MQQSRKLQFIEGDSARDQTISQQQAQQQEAVITQLPQQIAPQNLFDPTNFFSDFHSGNPNVQAFWKVPCVQGGLRRPCFWIPITCMQFNQGTYSSWWEAIWDGFAQTSIKRTVVIKKNLDRSSPLLMRYVKAAIGLRKTTIVFVRKIPIPATALGTTGQGGQGGGGGGGEGFRRRCKDRSCHGRCDRCRTGRNGFSGDSANDWETLFPFRQQALVINLYCSRISGGMLFAGDQCRSKPTGCATGCQSFPGAFDPSTWLGGPGLAAVGPEWQVVGQGPNFPETRFHHGLGPIAQEQYQVMWSSATIEVELRNPVNGCRYWKETQTIPI